VLNLIVGFAIALKHHLREERGIFYDDLYPLIKHLPRHFNFPVDGRPPNPSDEMMDAKKKTPISMLKQIHLTEYQKRDTIDGIPSGLFMHDCRDLSNQGTLVQGNIPLEIANYITSYFELCASDDCLIVPVFNASIANVTAMVDILTDCERILRTPIPLAYNIAISQTGITLILA